MVTAPVIVAVLLPPLVTTPLTAIVLARERVEAVAEIATGSVIVHELFAGMVPPVSVIVVPGVAEVRVDPHVPPGTAPAGTVKPLPMVVSRSVSVVMVTALGEIL